MWYMSALFPSGSIAVSKIICTKPWESEIIWSEPTRRTVVTYLVMIWLEIIPWSERAKLMMKV